MKSGIITGILVLALCSPCFGATKDAKNAPKTPTKNIAKTAPKTTPAKSKDAGAGKYKSNGPIEITSDSLEVLQQEHKAVFTGHVVAVQGDVRMKSEKMTVFYKNSDSSDKTAKKDKTAATVVPEKNAIEKIVVENNVFLSTPEETASGAHGLYDVVNHKIFLNDNVVLTRDKNVLKGDRLVYNFNTGKSELNSPESGAAADPGKPKQRVKALFITNSDKASDKNTPVKK